MAAPRRPWVMVPWAMAARVRVRFGFDGRWRSRDRLGAGELRVPHGGPLKKHLPAQPSLAPSSLSMLDLDCPRGVGARAGPTPLWGKREGVATLPHASLRLL